MDNQVVCMKSVRKQIKGRVILDNVSFEANEGETYAIVGRNASGKSMFLKAMCGLISVDAGIIRVFGDDICSGKFPRNTGILIEHPGFLPQYSGYKNLKLLAEIQNTTSPKRISDAMELVGLDSSDARPYRKYSLGMRQKLGLAQALMENPRLLILDEPMNNLDAESIDHMREVLHGLSKDGVTMIIATHLPEDVQMLCTVTYSINNGLLKKEGEK